MKRIIPPFSNAAILIVLGGLLFSMSAAMCGCVSVSYDPQTGAFNYTRTGNQEIQGFSASKDGESFTVEFESQQSDMSALVEAAARGAASGVKP